MNNQPEVVIARFWTRVDRSAGPSGCWPYMGSRLPKGYGSVKALGERIAHRLSYKLVVGPISQGNELDHLCRNTTCVNPKHLESVTPMENARRTRKTHCARGHEFTVANTIVKPDGRACRQCTNARNRAWMASR